MVEKQERLARLDRRFKVCKLFKWILGIASVAFSVIPPLWVAFKVAPSIPKTTVWIGVSGAAAFVLAVGLILLIRGLNKRYGHNLPWATSFVLWSWVLYGLLHSLGKVIVQAEQVSLALAMGASAAFVLSLGSECFRVIEKNSSEEYRRLK